MQLKSIKDKTCLTLKLLTAVCLVVMVVINVAQVLCRYFINVSLIWCEDLSLYLLHWMLCFTMPMVWLLNEHMVMDIVDSFFAKKFLFILNLIVQCFGFAVGLTLVRRGLLSAKRNHGYVLSVLGYDEMWKYIPYIICGVLLAFVAVLRFLEIIQENKEAQK